jgi:hypothetical protein
MPERRRTRSRNPRSMRSLSRVQSRHSPRQRPVRKPRRRRTRIQNLRSRPMQSRIANRSLTPNRTLRKSPIPRSRSLSRRRPGHSPRQTPVRKPRRLRTRKPNPRSRPIRSRIANQGLRPNRRPRKSPNPRSTRSPRAKRRPRRNRHPRRRSRRRFRHWSTGPWAISSWPVCSNIRRMPGTSSPMPSRTSKRPPSLRRVREPDQILAPRRSLHRSKNRRSPPELGERVKFPASPRPNHGVTLT